MTNSTCNKIRLFLPVLATLILGLSGLLPTMAQDREPIVWKIKFDGNDQYPDMVLTDIIAAESPGFFKRLFRRTSDFRLDETELRRDVIRIRNFYARRGFSDIEVDFEIEERKKEWQRVVRFNIREGTPILVENLTVIIDAGEYEKSIIEESTDYQRALERHEKRVGLRYQIIRKADVEGRFNQVMQDAGFPYSSVSIEAIIDSSAKTADVTITNHPGGRKYFSTFQVEGELTVDERIVIRETDISPGTIYSRRKIQAAQRELFNHHLFRFATINIPQEEPADSLLDLTIRVREYPLRSVQATIGVGREEIVRGQVSWTHRNINSRAHRYSVTGRASFIEQRLGMDYLIPYVYNTRSGYIVSPFIQYKEESSFRIFRGGITNSFIYQHSPNTAGTISYELTRNRELTGVSGTSLPDTLVNYNTSSLTFSGFYRQHMSESRGWTVQPFIELSGTFSESSYTYQKASLDVRRYTPITESTTLAARIQGGAIFYTGNDSLPGNIRYYAGGTNTVRGWSRQSLGPKKAILNDDGDFLYYIPSGGRGLFNFNVELRQQLNFFIRGFGIAAFIDGGQVWGTISDIRSSLNDDARDLLRYGIGGGLRYQSPIGPVRIDIAYKVNPTDEDLNIYQGVNYGSAWDRIGIHFSIGQAF